jgi:hypothetical protein
LTTDLLRCLVCVEGIVIKCKSHNPLPLIWTQQCTRERACACEAAKYSHSEV